MTSTSVYYLLKADVERVDSREVNEHYQWLHDNDYLYISTSKGRIDVTIKGKNFINALETLLSRT